jgi:hypothetical protein
MSRRRRVHQKSVDVLLQGAIRVGHALVLTHVLEPGIHSKGFEKSSPFCHILE